MAFFTGTTQVYGMAGATGVGKFNREDLSDLIVNISPTKTPFVSNVGRTEATAVLHEWMQDSLAAAALNTNLEGNEITFASASSGTRATNYCQILVKSVIVSGSQEAVRKAGKRSELAYQVAKQTKEIARDLEYACLQSTTANAGGPTTARQMEGVVGWVTTNGVDAGTGTVTVVQTDLEETVREVWNSGGDPDMILCHGFNKQTISGFTTGVTKNLDANDKKLVSAVNIYESDFGLMRIYPDHFIATDDIAVLQSDLWRIAYLRPLRLYNLAKTGDADKKALIMECTLECGDEKGNGMIVDTATS